MQHSSWRSREAHSRGERYKQRGRMEMWCR
jgi:hypothetical protein